jgi:RNA polymerase sigma factor (sigma-70 family)
MLDRVLNNVGKPDATDVPSRGFAAEQELVAAAKRGDEGAFETLFNRHQGRIFVLAFRYTRVREDAEDVVQQTFQKAFVHLQKFEGKSSLSTWLTRIAINQALMLLRSRRGRDEVPIDVSSTHEARPALELADASPDPEASYLQAEKTQILSAAMRQLRPGMRRAIELRELGELSNRDTAEHLGVSIGTVKARVFHARRRLRKALRHHMGRRQLPTNGISIVANDAGTSRNIAWPASGISTASKGREWSPFC